MAWDVPKPLTPAQMEAARQDAPHTRGRYGRAVPEHGFSGVHKPWCNPALGRSCHGDAKQASTVWGRSAPERKKPTHEERHGLTPLPSRTSKQSEDWTALRSEEEEIRSSWRELADDLDLMGDD